MPNGFHIIELAMLRSFGKNENAHVKNANNTLIVGEAKTSTKQMTKQLEKYLDTNLFETGFEIHPQKQTADKDYFGLFTLNKNFEIQYTAPKTTTKQSKICQKRTMKFGFATI